VREITSNAVEVSPDKQGRILIPSWLQEAASLKGSVLLNGNIDRVEVWDPDEYRAAVQDRAEGFQRFAHKIFG
jgi:MraZ protein